MVGVVVGARLRRSSPTGDGSAGVTPEPNVMDVTGPVAQVALEDTAIDPGQCTVCPHAWSGHDALGVRYCSATMASARTRGCICRK